MDLYKKSVKIIVDGNKNNPLHYTIFTKKFTEHHKTVRVKNILLLAGSIGRWSNTNNKKSAKFRITRTSED